MNNRYTTRSAGEYIQSMFDATVDGKLTLTRYPDQGATEYTQDYSMTWNREDAQALAQRCEHFLSQLEQIGRLHTQLMEAPENPQQRLSPELLSVWKTYILPFPDHGMDSEALAQALENEAADEKLTADQLKLTCRYRAWYEENAQKRLPYCGCSPAGLINRAQRYEKLISLRAPEMVSNQEALRLAEEMVLYSYMKANSHTCRCCGHTYDLEPYAGFVTYSICPICQWEEDHTAGAEYSDVNGASLEDYRRTWTKRV